MEVKAKFNPKAILSPQPKRLVAIKPFSLIAEPPRSQSCEIESNEIHSELLSILSSCTKSENSVLSLQFSSSQRSKTNPIIFDEKFVQLEYSLSTSEDSGSDSDRLLESV